MAGATSTVRIDIELLTKEAQAQVKLLNNELNKIGKGMNTKAPETIEQTGKNLQATANAYKNYEQAQRIAGLTTSANVTKLKGLKVQMNQNETAMKAQKNILETLTSTYGKESTKVMDAKNKLMEINSQQKVLSAETKDLSKSYGNLTPRMAAFIDKCNLITGKQRDMANSSESAKEKVSGFGNIMKGTFVGGAILGGVQSVVSGLKNLGSQSISASDAMFKFKSTMQLGGFGSKEINAASKDVRKYADETVYELGDVANTTAQLAANGIKGYMGLTKAAGNLNAQAGGNAETFKSVAMMLTQTAGAGKLTTENWNQLADAIPGASGKLQEAMKKNGAYTGNFRDAMANGDISAKEFNKAITQLGSNKAAVQAAKSTETFEGAFGNLEAGVVGGIQNMIEAFGKNRLTGAINGITKVSGDVFKALTNDIKDVMPTIDKLGKDTAPVIDKIAKAFKSTYDALIPVVSSVGELAGSIGKQIWKNFKGIISDVADSVNSLFSKKNDGALSTVAAVISGIAKNKLAVQIISDSLIALMGFKMAKGGLDLTANIIGNLVTGIGKLRGLAIMHPVRTIANGLSAIKSKGIGALDTMKLMGMYAKDKYSNAVQGLKNIWSGLKNIASVSASKIRGVMSAAQTKGYTSNNIGAMSTGAKVATAAVGVGVAASAGLDIYSAFKAKNPETKFKKAGQGLGTAIGGGIGFFFGGPAGAALGASIGKVVGGWSGKAAKSFTDGWNKKGRGMKPPKGILPKAGYYSRAGIDAVVSFGKGFSKNASKLGLGGAVKKELSKARKVFMNTPFGSWIGSMASKFSHAFPNVSKIFSNEFKGVGDIVQTALNLIGDNFTIWSDIFSGNWGKLGKDISKAWSDLWKGVQSVIEDAWNVISGIADSIGNAVSGIVGGIKKVGGKIWDKLTGHATGGPITSTHVALVGEEGPEIAYNKKSGKARILGSAGPEVTTVFAGENILTASQSKKALHGKSPNILKSYAGGTGATLGPNKIGGSEAGTKSTKFDVSMSDKDVKKGSISVVKEISEMTKKSTKALKTFADFNKKNWKQIVKETDKNTVDMRDSGTDNINSMSENISDIDTNTAKFWHRDWQNMATDFNVQLSAIINYARQDMNGAIGQLNHGIGNINGLVAKFGGNSAILPQIPTYANGTGGRLGQDELALVNDGQGPNYRELIQHNDGSFTMMKERNRLVGLKAGEKVYNGQQSNTLINSGLVVPHALGTVDADDALLRMVSEKQEHPDTAWKSDFDNQVSTSITPDVARSMAISAKNSIDKQGLPWYAALWEEIADLIGAGSGSRGAFLKYAIENFMDKPYLMGGNGPTYYDCSGMVAAALKHFGIDIGRTTTTMQTTTDKIGMSDVKPGDLTIWGHGDGADGHVGILMNRQGKMFNETPPQAGYGNVSDVSSIPWDGAFRIRQLHDEDSSKWGVTPQLKALVKSELGSSATSWIQDHFQSAQGSNGAPGGEVDLSKGNASGGKIDIATLRKAAQIDGVKPSDSFLEMLARVMMSESGGNANAENNSDGNAGPNHSIGALQYTAQTWNAFARAGYGNRRSILDNAVTFFNNSDWANSIGYTTYPAWNGVYKWDWKHNGPQGQRRLHANGGWGGTDADIFNEVPGEREVVVNPHRKSAFKWIKEAIAATYKYQPSEARKAFAPVDLPEEMKDIDQNVSLPTEMTMATPESVSDYKTPSSTNVVNQDGTDNGMISNLLQKISGKGLQITVNMDSQSIIAKNIPLINALLGDDSVNIDVRGGMR